MTWQWISLLGKEKILELIIWDSADGIVWCSCHLTPLQNISALCVILKVLRRMCHIWSFSSFTNLSFLHASSSLLPEAISFDTFIIFLSPLLPQLKISHFDEGTRSLFNFLAMQITDRILKLMLSYLLRSVRFGNMILSPLASQWILWGLKMRLQGMRIVPLNPVRNN